MLNILQKSVLQCLLLLACYGTALSEEAQLAEPQTMLGPLVWSSLNRPINAYVGTDNYTHLEWIVMFTNTSRFDVLINDIRLLDLNDLSEKGVNINFSEDGTRIIDPVRPLAKVQNLGKAGFSRNLGPGQSGIGYFNVSYQDPAEVPALIKLGVTMSFRDDRNTRQELKVIDNGTEVNTGSAVEVSPPLAGSGWMVANGSGPIISRHRSATQATNGIMRAPEQFAIDFIKLKLSNGRYIAVSDNPSELKSWFGYGSSVYSATEGRVIVAVDTLPDQSPVGTIKGMRIDRPEDFAGNRIIVDMGQGRYVLYAHLMPGSVSVYIGQQLRAGQTIGRVGNSGNSDAPHLHFQIMDSPSVLNTTALPFTFNRFTMQGRFVGSLNAVLDKIAGGEGDKIDARYTGERRGKMPFTLDLIGSKSGRSN